MTSSDISNDIGTEYARWFRDSTPYISAHRNKTFVVLLGGDAFSHSNFVNIVHDLALLHVLGAKVVLVHGAAQLRLHLLGSLHPPQERRDRLVSKKNETKAAFFCLILF